MFIKIIHPSVKINKTRLFRVETDWHRRCSIGAGISRHLILLCVYSGGRCGADVSGGWPGSGSGGMIEGCGRRRASGWARLHDECTVSLGSPKRFRI